MPDTPTPAPALTDEQMETVLGNFRKLSYGNQVLAAVVARAKREAAEEIARVIDVEYGTAANDDRLPNAYREGVIEGLTRALLIVRATR